MTTFFEADASPSHLARAEPVIGRRFAPTYWRFRPVMTISIGMTAKLFRRGANGRTAGRPVQECDRCKGAKPGADRREGDINPVFRIADHGVGGEQVPYAAPRRRRHA